MGAPTGYAGATLEVQPLSWLTLAAGAGVGSGGPQGVGEIRLRVPLGRFAVYAGSGVSGGSFAGAPPTLKLALFEAPEEPPRAPAVQAIWTNIDAGVEYLSEGGFHLRVYAGAAISVVGTPDDVILPYGAVSVGIMF